METLGSANKGGIRLNRRLGIAACFLALATAWVYSTALSNDFAYYDDEHYLTTNVHVQKGLSWRSIQWAFTSIGYCDNWHPLTWLSHMLDVQLFGLKPAGHHFTSLALHVLAAALLLGFLSYTTKRLWPSTLVSVLFALHPLHVESVAWAAERKDVLSAVFWFATLCAYAYYARGPSVKKYLLVVILYALGLMAKPMLVTLPLILLLLDYWPLDRLAINRRSFFRRLAEKVPLFVLALASSTMTVLAQQRAIGSLQRYPLSTRISNAVFSCCVYLGQAFWPADLSVLYAYPQPQFGRTLGCWSLLIAITAAVAWLGRNHKHLVTGWLWYAVSLLPVIGIVQVGSQPHADRYTYIPLVGVFIMFAWGACEIATGMSRSKKLLANLALFVVVVCMAVATRKQIGYWKNGIALFTHGFEVTKGIVNENAYYNFGNLMSEAGRANEAMTYFERALKLNPNHARSHLSYGLILSKMGRTDEAILHYQKALEQRPDLAEAHNNLGTSFAKLGRVDEARAHFSRALEIDPTYGDAHFNFGFLLASLGRTDEAVAHYLKALEIRPDDGGAHFNLALAFASGGRGVEAKAHFQKALELDPNNTETLNNLGILSAEMGRTDEAIAYYRKALERHPDAIVPLQNLAIVLVAKGQQDDAISIVRMALASARAAGDGARVEALLRVLSSLDEAINASEANGATHVRE